MDLDIRVLRLKADQLDKELGEVNDELTKLRENRDKEAKDRFDTMLRKAKRAKKSG